MVPALTHRSDSGNRICLASQTTVEDLLLLLFLTKRRKFRQNNKTPVSAPDYEHDVLKPLASLKNFVFAAYCAFRKTYVSLFSKTSAWTAISRRVRNNNNSSPLSWLLGCQCQIF